MQEEKGVKIGARVLDDDTLRILIPDYESIFSEIEKIRGNITPVETQDENKTGLIKPSDDEFFKHHNNIFSILGERGAGKTSVQLTLKYKLGQIDDVINSDKTEEKDVVKHVAKDVDTILPIIVPQDMDDDSSVIGWIIAHFSNIIKDLFKVEERCYYFNEKEEEKIKKLKARFEDLKKSYFLRQDTYKSSLSVEDTIHNYVQKNEEVIRENIDLSKKFKVFIDEFIEFRKNNKKTNPLIFIFFDDVDISNKRCLMVLETLLRYLSHSNIVVFVAGDYLTFKETITLSYLKEDGLLDKELMVQTFEKKSALEIRQTLAYDYLKKVLSPALRYELKTLSLENKKMFKCKKDSLSLEELLKEKVQFFDPFYEILDSKPRGLINVYYFLRSIHTFSMSNDELRRFIATLINSSSDLNTKKEEIEEIIEFNPNIDINFSKFKKFDYSSVNLKILILILFADKDEKLKEYEKEILEYFKNYLESKIEIIGEVRIKNDIFDVFLEGKDIHENLDLFYNLLIKFEGKKISQSKFYQKYFSQILKTNNNNQKSEVNRYYTANLYLNKHKITKIIEGLKSVNNTIDVKLALEMELRFKNLYLLDEWREKLSLKLKKIESIKTWKKANEGLSLNKARSEALKKINNYILNYNVNESFFIEDTNLDSLNITNKLELLIKNLEEKNKMIEEIYNNEILLVKEEEKIVQYRITLGEKRYKNIVLKISDFEYYKNFLEILSLLIENIREVKYNDKQNNQNDMRNKIEELEKSLPEISELLILKKEIELVKKLKVHLLAEFTVNSLEKLEENKIKNIAFKETIDKYIILYKKVKNYEFFNENENLEELLAITTDKLLDFEEAFIKNKVIYEIRNSRVLSILRKEGVMEINGYLNSDNYINVKKIKEKYNKDLYWFEETNEISPIKIIQEYIKTELGTQRSGVLKTEAIELEFLKECFRDFYSMIEKKKINSQKTEEVKTDEIEVLYMALSQERALKRYFK